ncbi:ABC transporter permease [Spirochaeta africana]|nr:ABC transporter permease [Spirochaeta africana]
MRSRAVSRDRLYPLAYFGAVLRELMMFWRQRHTTLHVLIMQIFFTGVEAVATIALISLGIGAIIIVQGMAILPQFGAQDVMYTLLILIITRELGPLLTAFIVAARSGSAISTELGNMVVSHEVEAYVAVGINPVSYLAVPRVIGVTLSLLGLNIYFNIFGLVGSYGVVRLFQDLPLDEYVYNLATGLELWDLLAPVLKSVAFGMIIGTVSTYYGFQVKRAITEVPQKTIKAIGSSIVLCIIANAVITALSYTMRAG